MSLQSVAYPLIQQANFTGDHTGGPIPVTETGMLGVFAQLSNETGAATYTGWIQASPDDGTTWFDVPYRKRAQTSALAADVAADTDKRNVCDEETAVGLFYAEYDVTPYDLIRWKGLLSGTSSPAFDVEVWAIGK